MGGKPKRKGLLVFQKAKGGKKRILGGYRVWKKKNLRYFCPNLFRERKRMEGFFWEVFAVNQNYSPHFFGITKGAFNLKRGMVFGPKMWKGLLMEKICKVLMGSEGDACS